MWLEHRTVRLEQGDDLSIERETEHVLYFRWRIHANRASKLINQSRSVRLSRTNGQPRYIIEAIAQEDLLDESVRQSLHYMLTITAVCHGTYDGFGAPIMTAAEIDAPPTTAERRRAAADS
jgi:hypothetical protein